MGLFSLLFFVACVYGHSEYWPALHKMAHRSGEFVRTGSGIEDKYLVNVRNITDGGTFAEAYWSNDGQLISFQGKDYHFNKMHRFVNVTNVPQRNSRFLRKGLHLANYFSLSLFFFFFPDFFLLLEFSFVSDV